MDKAIQTYKNIKIVSILSVLPYSMQSIQHKLIFDIFLQSDAPPFPTIKSTHSLVAKHVTPEKWAKLGGHKTKTSGFTLGQVSFIQEFLILNVNHIELTF